MALNGESASAQSLVFLADPVYGWRPAIQDGPAKDGKCSVLIPKYASENAMQCDCGRAAIQVEHKIIDLKDYALGQLPLPNVDANGNLMEFADVAKLPYVHEAAILYNLKKRHKDGKPYTRTGNIIIAVNPFQWLTHLYTENARTYYSNRLVWELHENDPQDDMEPHVYEVSALAFRDLAFTRVHQSILVSGESGAGKTEIIKIALLHIASVQQGPRRELEGNVQNMNPIVDRVVRSHPLLEAFGNAKTLRNDNASRFGKYLQLQFEHTTITSSVVGAAPDRSQSTCVLAGSKCKVFLLEKNRVCTRNEGEGTFHIFYQLLAAPDSMKIKFWDKLVGKSSQHFKYVADYDPLQVDGMTDAQSFQRTCDVLRTVRVMDEELKTLMRAICVVLQCGNLTFGPKGEDRDGSKITSVQEIRDLAELLGVNEEQCSLAFTQRTMSQRGEVFEVPLEPDQSVDACNALAKEVYGNVFSWIVQRINAATNAEANYKSGTLSDFGIIGLLDIFGFESFQNNRFEQLCINYANELLQDKFTQDVFRAVQIEYQAEGIGLADILYDDNTDVLDLLEGRCGLFAQLNEECMRPRGNDMCYICMACNANKRSPCLIGCRDATFFCIHHTAGKITYNVLGFVHSNREALPVDLENLRRASTNAIVSLKHDPQPIATDSKGRRRSRYEIKCDQMRSQMVLAKYKTQLSSLMDSLRNTCSRYIRCIRPNMSKLPETMDHIATIEQLRSSGVVAAATLARSVFSTRLENSAVQSRYGWMWDKNTYPSESTDNMTMEQQTAANAQAILLCSLKEKETITKEGTIQIAFVVGYTKSYFRAGALEFLETKRAVPATTIQKIARGMITRKRSAEIRLECLNESVKRARLS